MPSNAMKFSLIDEIDVLNSDTRKQGETKSMCLCVRSGSETYALTGIAHISTLVMQKKVWGGRQAELDQVSSAPMNKPVNSK
jgi:hypothetical protein